MLAKLNKVYTLKIYVTATAFKSKRVSVVKKISISFKLSIFKVKLIRFGCNAIENQNKKKYFHV